MQDHILLAFPEARVNRPLGIAFVLGWAHMSLRTSSKRGSPLEDLDRFAGAFGRRETGEGLPPAGSPRLGTRRSPAICERGKRARFVLLCVALLLAVVLLLIRAGIIELGGVRAAILTRVAAICPDQAGAYTFLGKHYNASGRPKEAVDACEKLVAIKPDDPGANVLLGDAYSDDSRPTEAVACYHKAIAADSNCFDGHFGLGKAYAALGRYPEAIDAYQRALKIKPDSAAAHMSLGLALSSSGHYEEAMQSFHQAKQLDPHINEVQVLSGNAFLEIGLYRQAIACYRDAITVDQSHARAYYNLGRAYLEIGDRGLAREQQRILETLDATLADQLLRLIGN